MNFETSCTELFYSPGFITWEHFCLWTVQKLRQKVFSFLDLKAYISYQRSYFVFVHTILFKCSIFTQFWTSHLTVCLFFASFTIVHRLNVCFSPLYASCRPIKYSWFRPSSIFTQFSARFSPSCKSEKKSVG